MLVMQPFVAPATKGCIERSMTALEFIVFLRPIKSHILWEQMLGRGTRRFSMSKNAERTLVEPFSSPSASLREIRFSGTGGGAHALSSAFVKATADRPCPRLPRATSFPKTPPTNRRRPGSNASGKKDHGCNG
jgi:hypothetical protein